jgi:signal transduction histidine kinase
MSSTPQIKKLFSNLWLAMSSHVHTILMMALATFMCSLCNSQTLQLNHATFIEGKQLHDDPRSSLIKLPHSWNEERPQRKGIGTYNLNFTIDKSPQIESYAIYIPRIGNRFEIFINNELIQISGKVDDRRFFEINKSILTIIPKNTLLLGLNTISIIVYGESGRYAGLSTIEIGDFELLNKKNEWRQLLFVFSNIALVIICFFIAIISILYSYFSKNKYFFCIGASSLAWGLSNICSIINYFPYNYRILLFINDFLDAIAFSFMLFALFKTMRVSQKSILTMVNIYLYVTFFLLVIYHDEYPIARTAYLDITTILIFISIVLSIKSLLKRNKEQSILIFFSLLLALFFFMHDQFFISHNEFNYELMSYSKYSYILFMIAISTALANQVIRVNSFIHKNHARIDSKLRFVKLNLAQSYYKKSLVEKKLILQQERWRLMQDMHDGLGHRLIGLQQAVQDPNQSSETLNQLVKLTIAELRTTIQSINAQHDNISYMLGDLRERLDFLCAQYKKELKWSVEEMPVLALIDENRISNIEKIVLEIFTNIAKHSNATIVKLTASYTPTENITIEIEENGHGFIIHDSPDDSKNATQSLGLVGIHRRANESKIKLHFTNEGKIVRLLISLR